MLKAYASGGKGNAAYTKKAIQQAIDSGMEPKAAKALVNRNANTKTRTTGREPYVRRVLG